MTAIAAAEVGSRFYDFAKRFAPTPNRTSSGSDPVKPDFTSVKPVKKPPPMELHHSLTGHCAKVRRKLQSKAHFNTIVRIFAMMGASPKSLSDK